VRERFAHRERFLPLLKPHAHAAAQIARDAGNRVDVHQRRAVDLPEELRIERVDQLLDRLADERLLRASVDQRVLVVGLEVADLVDGDEIDFVKVLDFGLVKNIEEGKGEDLTQTGLFMGSPKYMAPEQIRGEHVDARTDIYALGIMMYEMIVGKVPFDRPNSVNILMAHVNDPELRT